MTVRYRVARNSAKQLLREAGVRSAPVPVEKLVDRANAVIRYRAMEDGIGSGSVQWEADGRAVIGVNASHPGTRRRFTIAHELGHLRLHSEADYHFDKKITQRIRYRNDVSSTATNAEEIEANQFAAELLMPEEFLARDIEGLSLDDADIEALAREYEVSVQAMTIRLTVLGYLK